MKRRGFVAGVAALPFVGGLTSRVAGGASAAPVAPVEAAAPAPPGVEESVDATVLEYLDHCSSWSETVERLRDYVADGHPDGDVFAAVADAIECEVVGGTADQGESVLGLYAATALTLARLHQLRRYGSSGEHAHEVEIVQKLAERV